MQGKELSLLKNRPHDGRRTDVREKQMLQNRSGLLNIITDEGFHARTSMEYGCVIFAPPVSARHNGGNKRPLTEERTHFFPSRTVTKYFRLDQLGSTYVRNPRG